MKRRAASLGRTSAGSRFPAPSGGALRARSRLRRRKRTRDGPREATTRGSRPAMRARLSPVPRSRSGVSQGTRELTLPDRCRTRRSGRRTGRGPGSDIWPC
jgi:hypothetical protein